MFTPDERRALVFLAAVAAAGGVVRLVRTPGDAPGAALVAPELAAGDLAAQAARARRALQLARPLAPGERVDVDVAEAAELERLPRVGPELARRIAEDREAHGPFGSLEGLSRVTGIGPGLLAGLQRTAAFSGTPRLVSPPDPGRMAGSGAGPRPGQAVRAPAAGIGPDPSACPPPVPLPLNAATAEQLACLPGLGPALAARIVTDRAARGPFREVNELERVPGVGRVRLRRLVPLVSAP